MFFGDSQDHADDIHDGKANKFDAVSGKSYKKTFERGVVGSEYPMLYILDGFRRHAGCSS